ncbi:hypothetical protein N1851_019832 [Merluccius polli]|uniref:Uncharacterized protein n=1 Tax=Merluccius polli TaxID=89951 RepID=A0AA47ML62_MERPO|nr:hypothetical protein N1851_019832 [Merluccius polli]
MADLPGRKKERCSGEETNLLKREVKARHVHVQCVYGPGKEDVLESIGPCTEGPVAPARGQQVKQVVSRMLFFLRTLRKCRRICAFLTTAVVLADQERSSEMWVPRNLKCSSESNDSGFTKNPTKDMCADPIKEMCVTGQWHFQQFGIFYCVRFGETNK